MIIKILFNNNFLNVGLKIIMENFFYENRSKRSLLCKHYDIKIIRRYRLITGQKVRGIYKRIKDIVYEFQARNKHYPNNRPFFFHTGRTTGDEFIQFANITNVPPVFSLLENILINPIVNNNQNNVINNHQPADFQNLEPRNREMLNILNIFFYLHGLDVELPAFKIYEKIISNQSEFDQKLLLSLNTIIGHKFRLSLQLFLDSANIKLSTSGVNGNLAHFSFNHLIRYCQANPLPEPSFL